MDLEFLKKNEIILKKNSKVLLLQKVPIKETSPPCCVEDEAAHDQQFKPQMPRIEKPGLE